MGNTLCISLLVDEHYHHWDNRTPPESDPILPDVTILRKTVETFNASLTISKETIRKVERDRKEQRNSLCSMMEDDTELQLNCAS